MQKEKLYFTRLYDQWKGKDIAVEEEIIGENYNLYIQVPDMDITEGSVNSINATFKDKNGTTYDTSCEIYDDTKRIFKVDMPLYVLANEGKYEVIFSISYNSNGSINRTEKTAIQTFTVLDTIEVSDDEIINDDRYSTLTQLIKEISEYKIDTSNFASKEEVQEMIDTSLKGVTIESIKQQLNGVYITPQYLDTTLRNYVSHFESAKFALTTDLSYYAKHLDVDRKLSFYATKEDLNRYVLRENGKTLSSNDFTNELYNKLVNMPNTGANFDDTELRRMISEKADMGWVVDRFENLNSINADDYYDVTETNELLNVIRENHTTDINNLTNSMNTNINNLTNSMNTDYLKKEDYKYADGIDIEDIKMYEGQSLLQIIEDLTYKEIEIEEFKTSLSSNIREYGERINSITFEWKLNKQPTSQRLTDSLGSLSNDVRSYSVGNTYTTDRTFILTVTDGKMTKEKSITLQFVKPYLYGSFTENQLSSNLIANSNKIIDVKNNQTIKLSYIDASVFFAYPSTYGNLEDIKDGNGLSYFDDFILQVMLVNGENYNVYILKEKATVPSISFSFIFGKEMK